MSDYEIERNNFSREEKRCLSGITHVVQLEYVTHPKTFMITLSLPACHSERQRRIPAFWSMV